MWRNGSLNFSFAGNTTEYEIGALSSWLHFQYDLGKDIEGYHNELKTEFNKLVAMQPAVAEVMEVSTVPVSLAGEELLSSTVAAVKTMQVDKLTGAVSSRLIREHGVRG